MRSMWTKGLAVTLGIVAGTQAQNAPIATLGQPIAATIGRPVALTPTSSPVAVLARPVASSDAGVKTVSFDRPVFRAAAPDPNPASSSPLGPGTDPAQLGMYGWRRPGDSSVPPVASSLTRTAALSTTQTNPVLPFPTPTPMPSGSPTVGTLSAPPPPLPTAPIIGGPVISSPMIGSPVVSVPGVMPSPAAPIVASAPAPSAGCSTCAANNPGYSRDMGLAATGYDPSEHRWYIGAEYLLWMVKGDRTPALVTINRTPGLAPTYGVAGTEVLFGDSPLGNGARSGARLTAGYWFGDDHSLGLEIGGFFLSEKVSQFGIAGTGNGPTIGRPFYDANLGGLANFELVDGGGLLQGGISVRHTSSLWGYDINLKQNLYRGQSFSLDGLIGYRQMGLDESLSIRESLNVLVDDTQVPPRFQAGDQITVRDQFRTQNRFYGGQFGFASEWWLWDRLSLGTSLKVGMGYTSSRVTIAGNSSTIGNGNSQFNSAGLLAQASNIGNYSRDSFSVVPEIGLNIGYSVTDWMRLTVGYNALYWSNVARAGEQVPTTINYANAFGNAANQPLVPTPMNKLNDFWAHGITAGLEFRF